MPLFKKTKKETPRGRFIVIDGTDGSGKATQAKLLEDELKASGFNVEIADFPRYGQSSAWFVEEYLISQKYGQVNPYASSIFYAVDRFDAKNQICQWLDEGKIVISNRYVTANAGHQGGKIADETERLKFFKWLDNLEYNIFGIPKPDLNIILHVPAEIAQQLAKKKWQEKRDYMKGKTTDLHESDIKHLQDAENTYLQIAKLFPNTKLVECAEGGELFPPQVIHNKVWELARRIALKDLTPNT